MVCTCQWQWHLQVIVAGIVACLDRKSGYYSGVHLSVTMTLTGHCSRDSCLLRQEVRSLQWCAPVIEDDTYITTVVCTCQWRWYLCNIVAREVALFDQEVHEITTVGCTCQWCWHLHNIVAREEALFDQDIRQITTMVCTCQWRWHLYHYSGVHLSVTMTLTQRCS